MQSIKDMIKAIRGCMHSHEREVHKFHHACHLCYFALIVFHGPYHIAAGGLLVFGIISWLTGMEIE